MGIKKWNIAKVSKENTRRLVVETGLDTLVCDVLAARGLTTTAQLQEFFTDELHSPFLLPDMEIAVQRVQAAIDEQESTCIYGDYDCDGITSTVLLYTYLQNMGAQVSYYIPSRDDEGYGMNMEAVKTLHERGVKLIITVDNGSSAIVEIDYANSLGMQVVVTDHHKMRDTMPNAVAVINPHRADCTAPFKALAGVGVVFKLICALEGGGGVELLDYYGDLTCIGTIADIVTLTGENRTIARYGLERLQFTDNTGLRALMQVCGVSDKPITCENVAFMLAPRINAAGRMGYTEKAVELFLCEDEEEALELAEFISEQNKVRQGIEAQIVKDITEEIEKNPQILCQRLLVLSGEGWHHGIIGIVCSKLTERYAKPCVLISVDGDEARGSGRSVDGFSLIDAVSSCGNTLTRYGGHTMAAGFSLKTGQIEEFKAQLLAYAKQNNRHMPTPSVSIDKELTPKELSYATIEKLKLLEPFGMGNEPPVFALMGVKIEAVYPMGAEGGHLRLRLNKAGESFYAVYFGMSQARFSYAVGDIIDIAAGCECNVYNDEQRVTVKIKTMHPVGLNDRELFLGLALYESYQRGEALGKENEEKITPNREDIAIIYRYLRENNGFSGEAEVLAHRSAPTMGYCKLRLALDIMAELGLITLEACEVGVKILLCKVSGKVDISSSKILQGLSAKL